MDFEQYIDNEAACALKSRILRIYPKVWDDDHPDYPYAEEYRIVVDQKEEDDPDGEFWVYVERFFGEHWSPVNLIYADGESLSDTINNLADQLTVEDEDCDVWVM